MRQGHSQIQIYFPRISYGNETPERNLGLPSYTSLTLPLRSFLGFARALGVWSSANNSNNFFLHSSDIGRYLRASAVLMLWLWINSRFISKGYFFLCCFVRESLKRLGVCKLSPANENVIFAGQLVCLPVVHSLPGYLPGPECFCIPFNPCLLTKCWHLR